MSPDFDGVLERHRFPHAPLVRHKDDVLVDVQVPLAAEVHLLGLVRAVGYRVEDDAALVAPPGQEVPEALLRAPSCLDGFRENLI